MIVYLLKSMLCLLALLLLHRLLLQREVLHRFNRFYLLAAVLGSFLIPLYTIEVPVEDVAPVIFEAVSMEETVGSGYETFSAVEDFEPDGAMVGEAPAQASDPESPFPWEQILWIVYFAVSAGFLIRFLRNLGALIFRIRRNPHVSYRQETLVLHPENQSPFSFLKYIFVSRRSFEQEGISDAVFVHEQCHVHEKHSWDILLLEGLLIPLWFHPGLYLARHAIRLNHEFIADQAALGTTPVKEYQQLLLGILSANSSPAMVSSLNFSLTKKRMQMMNKKPNSPLKWLKLLALVPVIGALVYFFGEKVEVQPEEVAGETPSVVKQESIEETNIEIRLLTEKEVEVDGKVIYVEQLPEFLGGIKSEKTAVRFSANPRLEMGAAADVQAILVENGLRNIVFEERKQEVPNPNRAEWQEANYRHTHFILEDENMVYTHKTYQQLTKGEKNRLIGPMGTPTKKIPHPLTFADWRNKDKHALWLDGQVISNEKLSELQATDIAWFMTSGISERARSARFPQPFQTHLYTPEYYEKEFGMDSPYQNHMLGDTITLTQRKVIWYRDIQKYPDPNTAYLQKNARYENLRTSGTIYIHKSPEEKALLDELYQELRNEYSKATDRRKKNLKEPITPDSDIPRNGDPAQSQDEKIAMRKLVNNRDNEMAYSLAYDGGFQSNALKEYLALYGVYQTKAYENHSFSQKTDWEIDALRLDFDRLVKSYERLTNDERRNVQRASFPYAKIEKDGKTIYKKFADLTEQERKELSC